MDISKYIILYASTDSNDKNIDSIKEYDAIQKAIGDYDHVELMEHFENVTPDLMHSKLDQIIDNKSADKKIIFQLAGHSDRMGFYLPKTSDGNQEFLTVKPSIIKKYFEQYNGHIECTIFSSCASVKLAQATYDIDTIVCSIGTNLELESEQSIGFIKSFYEKFRATHNYDTALNHAKHGRILFESSHIFWGACKQKKLPNDKKKSNKYDENIYHGPDSSNSYQLNRELIFKTFFQKYNLSELKTLCFILNIDYDLLSGSNKEDKIRELIMYLERRNHLTHLFKSEYFVNQYKETVRGN